MRPQAPPMAEHEPDADDRYFDMLGLYLDAWQRGLAEPETIPPEAGPFADRLAAHRRFFEQVKGLKPEPIKLPETMGRFRIERELGRGGFGIVYLAHDPRLKRPVALKVPYPHELITAESRRRFVREAQAQANLDHPNLVRVHDAGQDGIHSWIVMEYVDGPTLAKWVESQAKPLAIDVCLSLAIQLADGLQHAHKKGQEKGQEKGVIHCDVKPGNVLMASGQPRLTDFGLARMAHPKEHITRTGPILGTVAYMAPEQTTGSRAGLSAQTDIWALGVVLFELLTGRQPFEGNPHEVMQAIRTMPPHSLRGLRPDVSRDLEAVVMKCLEKEPAGRFASMAELAEELRRVAAGEQSKTRPVRWWHKLVAPLRRMLPWAAVALSLIASLTVVVKCVAPPPRNATLRIPTTIIAVPGVDRVGTALVMSPDGRTCLVLGDDRRLRRINIETGEVLWISDQFDFGDLFDAALSADGKRLVVMSEKAVGGPTLRVIETENGTERAKLSGFKLRVGIAGEQTLKFRYVAISDDGRRVAFGGPRVLSDEDNDEVRVWDESTGNCIPVVKENCRIGSMRLSASGDRLVISCDRKYPEGPHRLTLSVCELDAKLITPKVIHVDFLHRWMAKGLDIAPNGSSVAFGDDGGWVWQNPGGPRDDLANPKISNVHVDIITFDHVGGRFACYSWEQDNLKPTGTRLISIWNAKKMTISKKWPVEHAVDSLAFTPDGRKLVYGAGNALHVRSLE